MLLARWMVIGGEAQDESPLRPGTLVSRKRGPSPGAERVEAGDDLGQAGASPCGRVYFGEAVRVTSHVDDWQSS
jgi:hypothetical protein